MHVFYSTRRRHTGQAIIETMLIFSLIAFFAGVMLTVDRLFENRLRLHEINYSRALQINSLSHYPQKLTKAIVYREDRSVELSTLVTVPMRRLKSSSRMDMPVSFFMDAEAGYHHWLNQNVESRLELLESATANETALNLALIANSRYAEYPLLVRDVWMLLAR